MAVSLKIKHKLLFVWFGSILFSLVVFAALMERHVRSLHEEASHSTIVEAFGTLRARMADLTETLEHTAQLLGGREDIVASTNMINAYQDPSNYRPLIFDVEKQAMARKLALQARTAGLDAAVVFDTKWQPASFFYLGEDGVGRIGNVTYRQEHPRYVAIDPEGKETPETVDSSLLQALAPDRPLPSTPQTLLRNTPRGPALVVAAPISRHLPTGSSRTVGAISVAFLLDTDFAKRLEQRTGLRLAFALRGGGGYGDTGRILTLSDLPDLAKADPPPLFFSDTEAIFGAALLSTDDGKGLVFSFAQDKALLLDELGRLRSASFAILVIASLILVPAGAYLLNRILSRRVEVLALAVRGFEQGVYRKVDTGKSTDELGELAEAFNGMVEAIRDRETELRRSQARLANAQRIAHLGNWNLDLETGELWWSEETFRIFGMEPQDHAPTGEAVRERLLPDDREAFSSLLADARRVGGPYAIDLHVQLPDDTQRILHFQGEVELSETGDPGRLAGTVQDVTDQKLAEENLRSTVALLTQSNTQLERFAFLASHDLQEPLRNVISYAQLLERRYKGRLDPDADEFIAYVVGGAKRMRALIHDLLAFSRIGAKGQAFEAVDLSESLASARENLAESIAASRARIDAAPLPTVEGDPVQLTELFQNLIGNAIKFVAPGKAPEVRVDVSRSGADWVIAIQDHGIGMEPQYLDRIFSIFKRLHTAETYPGTGVGLAICKQIVERHGGRIWANSEPDQGSSFYFTLPVADKQTLDQDGRQAKSSEAMR